jgi:hypothetical protein
MPQFRVTKYNPQHRNLSGGYLQTEWTSFSDIGQVFPSGRLTHENYEAVEHAYIEAALAFLRESGCTSLRVTGLETRQDIPNVPREGATLPLQELAPVLRALLREQFWCRLEARDVFVHVGYDYYMYLGVPTACPAAEATARSIGLFVEEFSSPYAPSAA